MILAARLFLGLGGVEQSGDDGRRADADGNARLYEFGAPLVARFILVSLAHDAHSMACAARLEAE
jgi:hypothetical protein